MAVALQHLSQRLSQRVQRRGRRLCIIIHIILVGDGNRSIGRRSIHVSRQSSVICGRCYGRLSLTGALFSTVSRGIQPAQCLIECG